jgi:cytochrome b
MTTLENDAAAPASPSDAPSRRLVWDLPVRLFHWALVFSIFGAFVTNRLGVKYFTYHTWFGYAVIVLVGFRLSWGIYGTRHARFANFIRDPKAVLHYVGAIGSGHRTRYAGHNPLGALMVVALLTLLGLQAGFGLFANDEIFDVGPLAGLVSKSASLSLTSLHRKIFYVILAAVALHVGAVFWHLLAKRENLIAAMVTGKKPAHLVHPHEEIRSSRGLRAVGLLLAVTGLLALALRFAPVADVDVAGF